MTVAASPPAATARRPLASWIVYDMAAHGYTLIVSGVAYPVYFATVVAAGRGNTDMLWSIALGLPLVVAGVLGPLIGALADATGRRRALLAPSSTHVQRSDRAARLLSAPATLHSASYSLPRRTSRTLRRPAFTTPTCP